MNTEFKVTSNLNGLARRLVMEDVLDEAAAENACVQSNKKNKTLLGWLIKNEYAKADSLAAIAADEYGIPLIDISAFNLSQAPVS
jgi:type IV pilus assembly protein PilB